MLCGLLQLLTRQSNNNAAAPARCPLLDRKESDPRAGSLSMTSGGDESIEVDCQGLEVRE
jgi:hypothetical protein